jgi:hypothetical protein
MKSLKTMFFLLGEVRVDAGKVLELKARRPLSPPGAPLMRGRTAEGCGVANGDKKEDERGGSEENNDQSIASGTEVEEGSQRSTPGFEAASTAARKRKAEDSVNDKLTAMAATIEQFMAAQKEMAGSQKAFLESNKAILDRNKELVETIRTQGETIKTQGEEIEALKALMQKSPAHISYSEVTANSGTSVGL